MEKNRLEYFRKYHKMNRKRGRVFAKVREADFYNKYGFSLRTANRHGLDNVIFIYKRARYRCEECGIDRDLTIHHEDRNGRNKLDEGEKMNNDVDNLRVLCRSCHGRIHGKQRHAESILLNY